MACVILALVIRDHGLDDLDIPPDQMTLMGRTFVFMAVYSWVMFVAVLYLMKPVRTMKWWTGAFINICLGVTTCCLAPFCIPVAINWNREEVKKYFDEKSNRDEG